MKHERLPASNSWEGCCAGGLGGNAAGLGRVGRRGATSPESCVVVSCAREQLRSGWIPEPKLWYGMKRMRVMKYWSTFAKVHLAGSLSATHAGFQTGCLSNHQHLLWLSEQGCVVYVAGPSPHPLLAHQSYAGEKLDWSRLSWLLFSARAC